MPARCMLTSSANTIITRSLAGKGPALPQSSKAVNKEESPQEQQASGTVSSRSSGHLVGQSTPEQVTTDPGRKEATTSRRGRTITQSTRPSLKRATSSTEKPLSSVERHVFHSACY